MRQSNAINKTLTDQGIDINLVFVFWMDYAVKMDPGSNYINVLIVGKFG